MIFLQFFQHFFTTTISLTSDNCVARQVLKQQVKVTTSWTAAVVERQVGGILQNGKLSHGKLSHGELPLYHAHTSNFNDS
jgi:hypothetical protein